jgi:ATP/maltotriose-dependent transcriptional regulator MalT
MPTHAIAEPVIRRPGRIADQRVKDRTGADAPFDAALLGLTEAERAHLYKELESLTEREREVACAVCLGGGNEAVADRLCIALPTLRTHLMRINQKLGTASKSDLVRLISATLLDGYRSGRIAPHA